VSSFATICDPVTRTSFEIRKELIPADVAALLELACESPSSFTLEEFRDGLRPLFVDPVSESQVKPLYCWLHQYAIRPILCRNDAYDAVMKSYLFVQIGSIVDDLPLMLYGCYFPSQLHVPIEHRMQALVLSVDLLRWCKGMIQGYEQFFPGFVLPTGQHFYPLPYLLRDPEFPKAWNIRGRHLVAYSQLFPLK
jgi:hypothetical protein